MHEDPYFKYTTTDRHVSESDTVFKTKSNKDYLPSSPGIYPKNRISKSGSKTAASSIKPYSL